MGGAGRVSAGYSLNQIDNLKKSMLIGKLILCQMAFSTDSLYSKKERVVGTGRLLNSLI